MKTGSERAFIIFILVLGAYIAVVSVFRIRELNRYIDSVKSVTQKEK